jgi:large subunit ribosomal protein MRP49
MILHIIDNSHRNFWRTHLTRLKYYNPTVPMTVNRSEDRKAPALMTLHFAGPAADDPQAPPKEWTETIDMQDRDESSILAQLLERTKAQPVKTSPEDKELGQQLAEQEAEVARVRTVIQAMRAKRKEEEARLLQARGEAEALRSEV